jgi:hypothetical protein
MAALGCCSTRRFSVTSGRMPPGKLGLQALFTMACHIQRANKTQEHELHCGVQHLVAAWAGAARGSLAQQSSRILPMDG